jgi:predicted short-subunit dehydrogenase-like oxidoreductase (DUF2520 family)
MENETHKDSVAIVGLGKVGTAVGLLLQAAGYPIVAVSDPAPEALKRSARFPGAGVFTDCARAAALARCILITTRDDQIAPVCEEICRSGGVRPGDTCVHMSGAGTLDLLASARDLGAHVASIHPIQSFADVEGAIANLPGSTFGITAEPSLHPWALQFVRDLGGVPFLVAEDEKTLYHAAACMASNYLTTLMSMVEDLYRALGVAPACALQTFWPLVRGTLRNIEVQGTVDALTGPIARGDVGTLRKHLIALRSRKPDYLNLYCQLGLMTLALSARQHRLGPEKISEMEAVLKGGFNDEHAG